MYSFVLRVNRVVILSKRSFQSDIMSTNYLIVHAISNFVATHTGMNNLVVMSVVSTMVTWTPDIQVFAMQYMHYTLLLTALGFGVWIWRKRHNFMGEKFPTLTIYNPITAENIMTYYRQNPTRFGVMSEVSCSPLYDNFERVPWTPSEDTRVEIKDDRFECYGFLSTRVLEHRADNDHRKFYLGLTLSLNPKRSKLNMKDYLESIEKAAKDTWKSGATMHLHASTVMPPSSDTGLSLGLNTNLLYSGPRHAHDERFALSMATYFGDLRDTLWPQMCRVNEMVDCPVMDADPSCNALLYGPPGTGKSSFASRAAIALGRHLVVIDLRNYLHNKTKLVQHLNYPVVSFKVREPHEVVFCIEEIDTAIQDLYQMEQQALATTKRVLDASSVETKQQKQKKPGGFNPETLRLRDLLTIFQGPIPRKGGVILATTNKLDFIQEKVPELLRQGRLQPYKVGYLSRKWLNKLVSYYFPNCELTLPACTQLAVSTSSVVNLAVECRNLDKISKAQSPSLHKNQKTGFEQFEKRLTEHLKIV